MEWLQNITNKRRGRPAKNTNDAGSPNSVPAGVPDVSGDGQVGSDGKDQASENNGRGQRISWLGLVEAVQAESGLVSTAWHPEAEADVISTNASDVRVIAGEPAYQLSTGEIVTL